MEYLTVFKWGVSLIKTFLTFKWFKSFVGWVKLWYWSKRFVKQFPNNSPPEVLKTLRWCLMTDNQFIDHRENVLVIDYLRKNGMLSIEWPYKVHDNLWDLLQRNPETVGVKHQDKGRWDKTQTTPEFLTTLGAVRSKSKLKMDT